MSCYGITHSHNYILNDDDLRYLKLVNLNYIPHKHLLYRHCNEKYQIERLKGDILRIPNLDFYNNLNNDFGKHTIKPIIKFQAKIA